MAHLGSWLAAQHDASVISKLHIDGLVQDCSNSNALTMSVTAVLYLAIDIL